ncbi:MAG: GNAT family N-acetyltransferase [Clostridiaceae bacterium]
MIEVFDEILKVPEKWDNIFSESSYLPKSILSILEHSNPCSQSYVIINDRSAFVVYKLVLDIFSYSKLKLNLKVNIIGVPCSVAKSGYKVHGDDIQEMVDYIKKEKGSYIILNSDDSFLSEELIRGETLPTCKLNISWDTFEDYKKALRSHYRYRINSAIKKGKDLKVRKLECNSNFNEELYALYENVYEKSDYKLEKLSIDFFRNIPSEIYVFYIEDKAAAFVQLGSINNELNFIFGGLNYSLNHKYDLYMNMLIFILRYGIENKYSSIDFGQTAEDTKMKLGALQQRKYMHIYHPSSIVRYFIGIFIGSLSYKPLQAKFQVFKGE